MLHYDDDDNDGNGNSSNDNDYDEYDNSSNDGYSDEDHVNNGSNKLGRNGCSNSNYKNDNNNNDDSETDNTYGNNNFYTNDCDIDDDHVTGNDDDDHGRDAMGKIEIHDDSQDFFVTKFNFSFHELGKLFLTFLNRGRGSRVYRSFAPLKKKLREP